MNDQFTKLTNGVHKQYEEVLFLADPHFFLYIIPDAHLTHCFLPANTQTKQQGKSHKVKFPTLFNNRLISKIDFYKKR